MCLSVGCTPGTCVEWGQCLLPACCLLGPSQPLPGMCKCLASFLASFFLVNTGFTRRTHPCGFWLCFFLLCDCTWIAVLVFSEFLSNNTCSNQYWRLCLCAFVMDDEMLNHPSWWTTTGKVRKQGFLHSFFNYNYKVEWKEEVNGIMLCLRKMYLVPVLRLGHAGLYQHNSYLHY